MTTPFDNLSAEETELGMALFMCVATNDHENFRMLLSGMEDKTRERVLQNVRSTYEFLKGYFENE